MSTTVFLSARRAGLSRGVFTRGATFIRPYSRTKCESRIISNGAELIHPGRDRISRASTAPSRKARVAPDPHYARHRGERQNGRDEAFLNSSAPVRSYLLSEHLLRPARNCARERTRDRSPLFPPASRSNARSETRVGRIVERRQFRGR